MVYNPRVPRADGSHQFSKDVYRTLSYSAAVMFSVDRQVSIPILNKMFNAMGLDAHVDWPTRHINGSELRLGIVFAKLLDKSLLEAYAEQLPGESDLTAINNLSDRVYDEMVGFLGKANSFIKQLPYKLAPSADKKYNPRRSLSSDVFETVSANLARIYSEINERDKDSAVYDLNLLFSGGSLAHLRNADLKEALNQALRTLDLGRVMDENEPGYVAYNFRRVSFFGGVSSLLQENHDQVQRLLQVYMEGVAKGATHPAFPKPDLDS